jgi:hypothetical protein
MDTPRENPPESPPGAPGFSAAAHEAPPAAHEPPPGGSRTFAQVLANTAVANVTTSSCGSP